MKRAATICAHVLLLGANGCSGPAPPTALASGQGGPSGIAASKGIVFWANNYGGTIQSVPATGGTPTVLASGQAHPTAIAADSINVYWTNAGSETCPPANPTCTPPPDGSVMKLPIAGGAPTTLASGQNNPQRIVIDATNVYWTNEGSSVQGLAPSNTDGTVMQVPIGGGVPTTLASQQFLLGEIAVDASSVYFAVDVSPGNATLFSGAILKVPIGGGAVTTIASGQYKPGGLSVAGGNVYWSVPYLNSSPGALLRTGSAGGSQIELASTYLQYDQPWTRTTAVDGANLYWLDDHSFKKMPLTGGATTEVRGDVSTFAITDFTVDETNVYWTDYGSSKVLKTPKSP
jgi:hypothetical protein